MNKYQRVSQLLVSPFKPLRSTEFIHKEEDI